MEQKDLSAISFNYELGYYLNKVNIPNQDLVKETKEWFEKDAGSRAFTTLEALNLIWKQYSYIVENIDYTDKLIEHFQDLPLPELEKHILFGLIIKWFGGYPLDAPLGVDKSQLFYDFRKRLLDLFLNYPEETPEKEFCKRSRDRLNRMVKMETAMNMAIKNNVPVKEIWQALEGNEPDEEKFQNFSDLFDAACRAKLLENQPQAFARLSLESLHNYQFSVWLQDERQLQHGNTEQYEQLLTLSNFKTYLQSQREEQQSLSFLNGITSQKAFEIFTEQYKLLRNKFRIKRTATKQDCAQVPRLKEGDILSFDPAYETTAEAFTLLTQYYAKSYLELEKHLFISKYKVSNPETIGAEISELEKFIEKAKAVNLSDACEAYGKWDEDTPAFVYRRFMSGFYEHLEVTKYPMISAIGNTEATVYGRYFLFYEFLRDALSDSADIKELIYSINAYDEVARKDLDNGFDKLEEYISKEIYQNMRADESVLRKIKRELLTWRNQLENDFIDPENQHVRNAPYFTERKQNAERMQRKIDAALQVVELRLQHKADVSAKPEKSPSQTSTTANHMQPVREAFTNDADFLEAIRMIDCFFDATYTKPEKPLFVKNKNIKNLAFSLGEVWRSRTNDIITPAYLQFYIDTFSVFSKQKLDKKSFFSNNLYKYSLSKT